MGADPYRPITTSAKLSLPLNGTIYTTRRRVAGEKSLPEVGTAMTNELGSAFSASVVIESNEVPAGDGSQKDQTLVHAVIPSETDQLPSNWEWATCNIGGKPFSGITRTFIYKASDFNKATPALGSAMPVSSSSSQADYTFTGGGYILVARNAARSGMQLEPVFKVEVREYVKKVALRTIGVDSLTGKALTAVTTIYHAAEIVTDSKSAATLFALPDHVFWGLQDDGTENTGNQLSDEWYEITNTKAVAGTYGGGVIAIGTFTTNDSYSWPPVLSGIEFMDWERLDGGTDVFPRVVFQREGYHGPCRTSTVRQWSKTPFTIPQVVQMLPNSIHYASPFFTINVPECLHGTVVCTCDILATDAEYAENTGSSRTFVATNYTDWPASITAYDDQEPYRGGYLRTTRTVYRPDAVGGGNETVTIAVPTGLAIPAGTITDTEAVLNWDDMAGATGYFLEVSEDAGFTSHWAIRTMTPSTDTLAGLTPATTYYVRVSTEINFLRSVPCTAVPFTTDA